MKHIRRISREYPWAFWEKWQNPRSKLKFLGQIYIFLGRITNKCNTTIYLILSEKNIFVLFLWFKFIFKVKRSISRSICWKRSFLTNIIRNKYDNSFWFCWFKVIFKVKRSILRSKLWNVFFLIVFFYSDQTFNIHNLYIRHDTYNFTIPLTFITI